MCFNNKKCIPNLLRKYRRIKGLKQIDVANILGLKSASRISRWEQGTCTPNTLNVFKLSVLYKVMVDSLFIDVFRELRSEIQKREMKYFNAKKNKSNEQTRKPVIKRK